MGMNPDAQANRRVLARSVIEDRHRYPRIERALGMQKRKVIGHAHQSDEYRRRYDAIDWES